MLLMQDLLKCDLLNYNIKATNSRTIQNIQSSKEMKQTGCVMHTFNPSTQEAEADLLSLSGGQSGYQWEPLLNH